MKITPITTIQNYDLPRHLSVFLRLNVMFGNVYALIGIIFFLWGSIFALIFGVNSDLSVSDQLDENSVPGKAIITKISETGSEVNEQPVIKYTYKFQAPNGKEYLAESYSHASQNIFEGDSVPIRYSASDPNVSGIQDMRKAPFGAYVFYITLIFPSIGIIFLIVTIVRGKKNIALVRNGYLTTGKVVDKIPTNTRINNRIVYEIFFEYLGNDGVLRRASTKTHKPELVLDEEKEKLLFNNAKPDEAILIDALPKAVKRFFLRLESGSLSQIQ